MAVHVGPLSTSPDRDVPAEVVRVLGKVALAGVDAHVHIRSGIDSLLGDTHLTVVAGKLHVIARRTSLDALETIDIVALPEIDEEGYRSVLVLRTATGIKRVDVGATEENAVHALVAALAPEAVAAEREGEGQAHSDGEKATEGERAAEEEGEGAGAVDAARAALLGLLVTRRDRCDREAGKASARAAFIGLLVGRLAQRKAKLRADRAAHARVERKPLERSARVELRAEVGEATTDDDGDGVPDPPGRPLAPKRPDPPERSSHLGLAVLGLLLLVGFLAIVSRLFAGGR